MTKPVIAPGIENHLTIAVQRDVHLDVLPPGNGDNDYAFDDVDDLDVLSPVNDDHDAIENAYMILNKVLMSFLLMIMMMLLLTM